MFVFFLIVIAINIECVFNINSLQHTNPSSDPIHYRKKTHAIFTICKTNTKSINMLFYQNLYFYINRKT